MSLPKPAYLSGKRTVVPLHTGKLTDREKFFAALANPPKPTDKLVALAARYAREVESRQ